MPGVTIRNSGPVSFRTISISLAEQTTPESPAALARAARRRTWAGVSGAMPTEARSSFCRLVRIVTPRRTGRGNPRLSASSAAVSAARAIIDLPPEA